MNSQLAQISAAHVSGEAISVTTETIPSELPDNEPGERTAPSESDAYKKTRQPLLMEEFISSSLGDSLVQSLLTPRIIRMLTSTYTLPVTHQRLIEAMKAASDAERAFEDRNVQIGNEKPNYYVISASDTTDSESNVGDIVRMAGQATPSKAVVSKRNQPVFDLANSSSSSSSSSNRSSGTGSAQASLHNSVLTIDPKLAFGYVEQWTELMSHYEHFLTASGVTQILAAEEAKVRFRGCQF
jgi:hypothetical protein